MCPQLNFGGLNRSQWKRGRLDYLCDKTKVLIKIFIDLDHTSQFTLPNFPVPLWPPVPSCQSLLAPCFYYTGLPAVSWTSQDFCLLYLECSSPAILLPYFSCILPPLSLGPSSPPHDTYPDHLFKTTLCLPTPFSILCSTFSFIQSFYHLLLFYYNIYSFVHCANCLYLFPWEISSIRLGISVFVHWYIPSTWNNAWHKASL